MQEICDVWVLDVISGPASVDADDSDAWFSGGSQRQFGSVQVLDEGETTVPLWLRIRVSIIQS